MIEIFLETTKELQVLVLFGIVAVAYLSYKNI